ncbi:MAG: ROK family transcriptional regulator [Candidatus Obscuribacterales bacterium]|nr:ROK family transcriptional regulator [Candidatus Obscuribacterales bacterium]
MPNQSFTQMRLRNAESVVNTVRQHREISRADLARETGLSPASITSIVDELIRNGFLRETEPRFTMAGRRPIGLVFNPESGFVAGFQFELDSIKIIIDDLDGKMKYPSEQTSVSTTAESQEIVDLCLHLLKNACKNIGISPAAVRCIGMAVPGPVSEYSLDKDNRRPPELYNNVKSNLTKTLAVEVKIDSLVNSAALAEAMRGAGKDLDSMVYFRAGHALRSAILLENKLIKGKSQLAGDVGHIIIPGKEWLCSCGRKGCVNGIASVPSFIQLCRKSGINLNDVEDFPLLAGEGSDIFLKLIEDCAEAIAFAAAAAVNILAPDALVFSTPFHNCGAAFETPLANALSRFSQQDLLRQCRVLKAQAKSPSEAYGAALSALHNYPLLDKSAARKS